MGILLGETMKSLLERVAEVPWYHVVFRTLSAIMWLGIGILIGAVWWYP